MLDFESVATLNHAVASPENEKHALITARLWRLAFVRVNFAGVGDSVGAIRTHRDGIYIVRLIIVDR